MADVVGSLDRLADGTLTLAELEGLTAAQAYAIADFGWMLLEQGRFDAAAAVFETLTLSNPRHAYFFALLGAAHQRAGRADRALESYARALEIDPAETAALVNRAELLLLADAHAHVDEAADLLQRAIDLDPSARRPETRRAASLASTLADRIAAAM